MPEAGAIGIIGGADGPTAIFISSRLANGMNLLADGTPVKNLIGPIAIAGYPAADHEAAYKQERETDTHEATAGSNKD